MLPLAAAPKTFLRPDPCTRVRGAAKLFPHRFSQRAEKSMRVGFIGLGMMGKGMAANLQKAGYQERASNGSRPILQDKVDALRA